MYIHTRVHCLANSCVQPTRASVKVQRSSHHCKFDSTQCNPKTSPKQMYYEMYNKSSSPNEQPMVNMHKYAYETNMAEHCSKLQQEVCSSKHLRQQVHECKLQEWISSSTTAIEHQLTANTNGMQQWSSTSSETGTKTVSIYICMKCKGSGSDDASRASRH